MCVYACDAALSLSVDLFISSSDGLDSVTLTNVFLSVCTGGSHFLHSAGEQEIVAIFLFPPHLWQLPLKTLFLSTPTLTAHPEPLVFEATQRAAVALM